MAVKNGHFLCKYLQYMSLYDIKQSLAMHNIRKMLAYNILY